MVSYPQVVLSRPAYRSVNIPINIILNSFSDNFSYTLDTSFIINIIKLKGGNRLSI